MKSIGPKSARKFSGSRWATAVPAASSASTRSNQPDVEAAKIKTRELTAHSRRPGALPAEEARDRARGRRYLIPRRTMTGGDATRPAPTASLGSDQGHLSRSGRGDYVACGYIERDKTLSTRLQKMRLRSATKPCRDLRRIGPRFLHRPAGLQGRRPTAGVFRQIPPTTPRILPVPGQKASFGIIKAERRAAISTAHRARRRALRVHLKGALSPALASAGCRYQPKRSLSGIFGMQLGIDRLGPDSVYFIGGKSSEGYERRHTAVVYDKDPKSGRGNSRPMGRSARNSWREFVQQAEKPPSLGDAAGPADHRWRPSTRWQSMMQPTMSSSTAATPLAGRSPPLARLEGTRTAYVDVAPPAASGDRARLLHDDRRREIVVGRARSIFKTLADGDRRTSAHRRTPDGPRRQDRAGYTMPAPWRRKIRQMIHNGIEYG